MTTVEVWLDHIHCAIKFDLLIMPNVGDKIAIMMEDEPMPDWIRYPSDVWEEIRAGGILLTSRTITNKEVWFDGRIWD